MNQTQRFDELNNFFSVMEISDDDKQKRVKLADAFVEVFMYLFETVQTAIQARETVERDNLISVIEPRFIDALDAYETDLIENYPDLKEYPGTVVTEVVDTTVAHIIPVETTDDGTVIEEIDAEYFLSADRAVNIGENEANAVGNAVLHANAVADGYTQKTWVTMKDEKVRATHQEADGQTVGINEEFIVGAAKLPYPRYFLGTPEETINCRCTVRYS